MLKLNIFAYIETNIRKSFIKMIFIELLFFTHNISAFACSNGNNINNIEYILGGLPKNESAKIIDIQCNNIKKVSKNNQVNMGINHSGNANHANSNNLLNQKEKIYSVKYSNVDLVHQERLSIIETELNKAKTLAQQLSARKDQLNELDLATLHRTQADVLALEREIQLIKK